MTTTTTKGIKFTRITRDTNGNSRFVFHFVNVCNNYAQAVAAAAKTIGGKKYHTKKYGGGIVVQSCSLEDTAQDIQDLSCAVSTAQEAAEEYTARQERTAHPHGSFDKVGRWQASDTEHCACCDNIRAASRAYPLTLNKHCRSAQHVANLFDVDVKLMRLFI